MWKDVHVGSTDGSAVRSLKAFLPPRGRISILKMIGKKRGRKSMFHTLFLLLALSNCIEESDNYGDELKVEKCGCIYSTL